MVNESVDLGGGKRRFWSRRKMDHLLDFYHICPKLNTPSMYTAVVCVENYDQCFVSGDRNVSKQYKMYWEVRRKYWNTFSCIFLYKMSLRIWTFPPPLRSHLTTETHIFSERYDLGGKFPRARFLIFGLIGRISGREYRVCLFDPRKQTNFRGMGRTWVFEKNFRKFFYNFFLR